MGRALAPLEDELVRDIQQAALLHIDETGHLEDGKLRCWAHLMRKAQGIAQSHEVRVRSFGREVVRHLETMMDAVYAAREGPPALPLTEQFAPALAQLRQLCEHYRDSGHTKTRALAREFLNDWDAIFAILADPTRPLTNNLAERALRHWVIHRRITYGTRTKAGTHAFGIIASVVDTCHLRNINPWPFLADSLLARRNGAKSLSLAVAGVGS